MPGVGLPRDLLLKRSEFIRDSEHNEHMAFVGKFQQVTSPVTAKGIEDTAIYLYNRLDVHLKEGMRLERAFRTALDERGTAIVFTAVTMTIGVGTWGLSPLKLQADMGVLLAFMFFLNMVGALFVLPALATYTLKPETYRLPAGEQLPDVTITAGKRFTPSADITITTGRRLSDDVREAVEALREKQAEQAREEAAKKK